MFTQCNYSSITNQGGILHEYQCKEKKITERKTKNPEKKTADPRSRRSPVSGCRHISFNLPLHAAEYAGRQ